MRVLVCGGRDYTDGDTLSKVLWDIHKKTPITAIIQGGAKGADYLASVWAILGNFDHLEFPANWDKYGKSAGPRRNKQMLDEGKPDLVVAFPGGAGTAHMVQLAKEAGVTVIEVE